MYKTVFWNTGPAAERARARAQRDAAQFNLKLKVKKNKKKNKATSPQARKPSSLTIYKHRIL